MGEQLSEKKQRRFGILDICATKEVFCKLNRVVVLQALNDHHDGNWGEISDAERAANESAIGTGRPILSRFKDGTISFIIFTSGDRQVTTIALSEDPEFSIPTI